MRTAPIWGTRGQNCSVFDERRLLEPHQTAATNSQPNWHYSDPNLFFLATDNRSGVPYDPRSYLPYPVAKGGRCPPPGIPPDPTPTTLPALMVQLGVLTRVITLLERGTPQKKTVNRKFRIAW